MASLKVTVVSADTVVWSGDADQVIARTSEGDVGILPGHSPMLAALAPSGVEVFESDGDRHVIAVEGGFVSVDSNRVSVLSEFATLASEITLEQAEKDLSRAQAQLDQGDNDEETHKAFQRATAQVRAGRKHQGSNHL